MSKIEILRNLRTGNEENDVNSSMINLIRTTPIDEALKEMRRRLKYFHKKNKERNKLERLERRKK